MSMTDKWGEAHSALVYALENAREAGIDESEVTSAVEDVYHEDASNYTPGSPKPKKKMGETGSFISQPLGTEFLRPGEHID